MNKLTAKKCREWIEILEALESSEGCSSSRVSHLEAYRIALPILEQLERGEGEWVEWKGGECPVGNDQRVHIQFRDGEILSCASGECLRWIHKSTSRDIIAYRIIPERSINQNGEQ